MNLMSDCNNFDRDCGGKIRKRYNIKLIKTIKQ